MKYFKCSSKLHLCCDDDVDDDVDDGQSFGAEVQFPEIGQELVLEKVPPLILAPKQKGEGG